MDYTYNYRFLSSWMRKNGISASDILSAIGTKAYQSVRSWSTGASALPLNTLLRICNTYQIPLTEFFFDRDDSPAYSFNKPADESYTEPLGGYNKDKEKDTRNHKPMDPKPRFRRPTAMPDEFPLVAATDAPTLKALPSPTSPTEEDSLSTEGSCKPSYHEGTPQENAPTLSPDEETVLVLKTELKYQQLLTKQSEDAKTREDAIRAEFLHRNEKLREKLYSIIEAQQRTIAQQQAMIAAMSTKKPYAAYTDDSQLAAEPEPEQKQSGKNE